MPSANKPTGRPRRRAASASKAPAANIDPLIGTAVWKTYVSKLRRQSPNLTTDELEALAAARVQIAKEGRCGRTRVLTDKKIDTDFAAHRVELARKAYKTTGNALFVWGAWQACRRGQLPLPEWVLGYIDDTADKLNAIHREFGIGIPKPLSVGSERPGDLWIAVAEALGLKKPGRTGRGTAFSGFDKFSEVRGLGRAVSELMRKGDKELYAVEYVAKENGVSAATVRRALKLYRDVLKR